MKSFYRICEKAKCPPDSTHLWYGCKTDLERATFLLGRLRRWKQARGYTVNLIELAIKEYYK